jgi:hypothetical protein
VCLFAGSQATRWPVAISVSGLRRAPARSRLGMPHHVLERRGSQAWSAARAGRAGEVQLRAYRTWSPRRARRQSTIRFQQVRGTDLSGPVNRIAQRQDSDSFSRAAASGDQRGAGAAGTDAGTAPRPGPDYPWPKIPHSCRARDRPPRAARPSNRREDDVADLSAEIGTCNLRSIIYDPHSLQNPDLEEVPRLFVAHIFHPVLEYSGLGAFHRPSPVP